LLGVAARAGISYVRAAWSGDEEAPVATIRSLLREHVTLQVRSVDRIFLHAWVPRLMTAGGVIGFLLGRGFPFPSPVLLGRNGRR
jgi:hypothetical protein